MISSDIFKKIREIEIITRRLLTGGLIGENQSAVKGTGFDFDQIRDYQVGDDTRFIDWKGSARTGKLLVKQYIEERNKNIIIALDISPSTLFTSSGRLRFDCMTEIATIFACVAAYSKDNVGMLLFSEDVELFIPLGRGMPHVRSLLTRMYAHKRRGKRTVIASACHHVASLAVRDAVVVLISDFIDDTCEQSLRVASKRHDLLAVRCLDSNERLVPPVGFLTIEDSETGRDYNIDTRTSGHKRIEHYLCERIEKQTILLRQSGADILDIDVGRPVIADILRFFKKRMVY